jgi:LmbE family N-acetylglucosaminyl deacetylase
MRRILVVAAHPDDEVLGCGGTIARHVAQGDEVKVVFMSDGVTSRGDAVSNEDLERRKKAALEASRILGVNEPGFLRFPDNCMDTVPLLTVVQALEEIVSTIKPSVVYTHYADDLNIDHQITNRAVMTACRPHPGSSVKEIFSFEILSSTEWAPSTSNFSPALFVDITAAVDTKLRALHAYADEMRAYPHSRSYEAAESLAKVRGASVGVNAAEAFYIERLIR